MEIIMPLIPLLSSSGLTRPAGQPQTAQVFADLLNKKVVETPGSILPEETLETIGDFDLPDEICERKKAGEIDFPETKIDLDIPVDADQKVVIDPEIIGAINPIVPLHLRNSRSNYPLTLGRLLCSHQQRWPCEVTWKYRLRWKYRKGVQP